MEERQGLFFPQRHVIIFHRQETSLPMTSLRSQVPKKQTGTRKEIWKRERRRTYPMGKTKDRWMVRVA